MSQVPYSFLADDIAVQVIRKLKSSFTASENLSPGEIANRCRKLIFAAFGYSFASHSYNREILFSLCHDTEVRNCLKDLDITPEEHEADNVFILSSLGLHIGSPVFMFLRDKFNFPLEYLVSPPEKELASEVLTPTGKAVPLFPYQDEISRKVQAALLANKSIIVQLPTGAGKTRTAFHAIIELLNRSALTHVLWLAHSRELCAQAASTFQKHWLIDGQMDVLLNRTWGTSEWKYSTNHCSLTVTTFSKLFSSQRRGTSLVEFATSKVDLIVVDEAHMATANELNSFLRSARANNINLLGLSATPGHNSSDWIYGHYLFDLFDSLVTSQILGDKPLDYLRSAGILSIIKHSTLKHDTPGALAVTASGDFSPKSLDHLGRNPHRNRSIIKEISDQVKDHKSVIVFCCSVEHSEMMAEELAALGITAFPVSNRTGTRDRIKAVSDFNSGIISVLLNYGVFTTGFDAPKVECVVIARPTLSRVLYSQMIGRGMRGPLVGGTEECKVIDVIDNIESHGDLDHIYSDYAEYWHNS